MASSDSNRSGLWEVRLTNKAERKLEKMKHRGEDFEEIVRALNELRRDPFPKGKTKRLRGKFLGSVRVEVARKLRIVYVPDKAARRLAVTDLGDREDILYD